MRKRGMTPKRAEKLFGKGTKLRTVRVRRGLSQSELAAASGVPVKTIQRYEQEPHKIEAARLNTLCGLSEALDCKIADILDDNELIERFNKVK